MEVFALILGIVGIAVGVVFWMRWAANNKAMAAQKSEMEEKISQLDGRRRKAERRLEELTDQSRRLERELQVATERREEKATARAMWELEVARAERRWREVVVPAEEVLAAGVTAGERLSSAIEHDVARLREEVGVSIRFEGAIDCELDPESAIGALRIAEEILALASRNADEIHVVVDQEISADDNSELVAIDVVCEGWDAPAIVESDQVFASIKTMAQRLDGWATCETDDTQVVLKSRLPAGVTRAADSSVDSDAASAEQDQPVGG